MKVETRPQPHFLSDPRKLLLTIAVVGSLLASFVFTARSAHAYTPTTANVGYNGCGTCSTTTITMTVFQSGDTIAVFAQTVNSADGTLYTISSITSTAVSGGFTQVTSAQGVCVIAAAFCGGAGANQPFFDSLWVGVATASGAGQTFIVTASGTVNAVLAGEAFDLAFVSTTPTAYASGVCNAVKNSDCGSPFGTSSSVGFTSGNAVEIAGAASRGSAIADVGDAAQYSANGPGNGNWFGMYSSTAASVISPTTFRMKFATDSGLNSGYALIGAVFGPSLVTTTLTTTQNTGCLGGCSNGNNGTSKYLTTNTLYFYQSQNIASPAQVDNFTVKVAAVHINAAQGNLWVVTCVPNSSATAASAGNLWNCFNPDQIIVQNGTTNFFIHANPQSNICSGCYYLVGIMATTTKSNSAAVLLSGVSLYETSQTGIIQYSYAVGSSTPPTTFFSNTQSTPRYFMYIHTVFAVAIVTTTTSFTQTITSGASTISTILTTITSTTMDATLAVATTTADVMILLVILLPAMILMLPIAIYTKSAQGAGIGFVAGLMIGSGVGVQAGLVPPVFMGLTVIVGIFMIVGLSRMSHGGM